MAETLRSSLEQVSQEHREAQARLDVVRRAGRDDVRIPTVAEFTTLVLDIEARIRSDPTAAREAIRKMLHNGRINMEPLPDGSYHARSVILPLEPAPEKPKAPEWLRAIRGFG